MFRCFATHTCTSTIGFTWIMTRPQVRVEVKWIWAGVLGLRTMGRQVSSYFVQTFELCSPTKFIFRLLFGTRFYFCICKKKFVQIVFRDIQNCILYKM